jgi:heterodisulfide reductase subunit A
MELERPVSSGSPTQGRMVRPSDMKTPRSTVFIQCVGSRYPKRGDTYCSTLCCINTSKKARECSRNITRSWRYKALYINIRAFGKGFDGLFRRNREPGMRYLRGLPGILKENLETGDLLLIAEDTTTN